MSEIFTYEKKHSTIQKLAYEHERGMIDTNPSYQRQSDIWTLEKKQLLIDSILNDFDIPKIYFHEHSPPKRLPNGRQIVYSIIDGRQRLETIWGFLKDEFPLSDVNYAKTPLDIAGLYYSEMSEKKTELKVHFDNFELPIICVRTDDIDIIEDMFSRLNEAVPLNAAEKRNAIGGPMPRVIREIAEHPFFKKVKFRNNRYQYREVATRLLFVEDCLQKHRLVDTKKIYLDIFVRSYKENPDLDPNKVAINVKKILNEMINIFDIKDDLLRSQATIPIYFLLVKFALKEGKDISRNKLDEFQSQVEENRTIAEKDISKANFSLLEYYRLSIQGTNDATSIKERTRIISKFFDVGVKDLDQ